MNAETVTERSLWNSNVDTNVRNANFEVAGVEIHLPIS